MSGIAKRTAMRQGPGLKRLEPLLGPCAAGLLGAASAFFNYAMPSALVVGAVGTLGLPPVVADSRLVLALGIGLAVAAATWCGFLWLDRAAAPRAVSLGAPQGIADVAPVLRRADSHPDAPPRRPIFAGSDLGTPLDLIDPLPADWSEPSPSEAAARDPAGLPPIAPAPPAPVPLPAAIPAPMTTLPAIDAPTALPATLAAMMARLETGLARKALALTGAEANVTALKREIRPIGGTLRAAVDELQQRTAARR